MIHFYSSLAIRSRCSFCVADEHAAPVLSKRVLMSATNDSSSRSRRSCALSRALKLLVVEVLHALAHIIISFSIVRSVLMMTGWQAFSVSGLSSRQALLECRCCSDDGLLNFRARPDSLDEHGHPAAIADEIQPFRPVTSNPVWHCSRYSAGLRRQNRLDLVFLPATLALDQSVVSDKAIG